MRPICKLCPSPRLLILPHPHQLQPLLFLKTKDVIQCFLFWILSIVVKCSLLFWRWLSRNYRFGFPPSQSNVDRTTEKFLPSIRCFKFSLSLSLSVTWSMQLIQQLNATITILRSVPTSPDVLVLTMMITITMLRILNTYQRPVFTNLPVTGIFSLNPTQSQDALLTKACRRASSLGSNS